MFCKNCGKDVGDEKFCPYCGTPVKPAQNQQTAPQGQAYQGQQTVPQGQQNYAQWNAGAGPNGQQPQGNYYTNAAVQVSPAPEDNVVKIGTWMFTMFMMLIPLVNIIYLIYCACDSSRLSRANWARAQLIWLLILFVAGIILSVCMGGLLYTIMG